MKAFSDSDLHFISDASSTNSLLREIWKQEPDLKPAYALACFHQTAGRGQLNNTWQSEAGKNIAYSVFLRPDHIEPKFAFVLSQAVSLALVQSLLETCGLKAEIKWPNDIYVKDGKIAGILIENELMGKTIQGSIVGIGLNVNQEHFHRDLPNPVSIIQLCAQSFDLKALTATLHANLGQAYAKSFSSQGQGKIAAAYHQHLYRREGFHHFKEGERLFKAKILRVQPSGQLELENEQGQIKSFTFKEIEYLI